MELLAELLMWLVWGTVLTFFGALAGVLYPPKSRSWAESQRLGIGLLCGAIIAWVAAYAAAGIFALPSASRALVVAGIVFFVAYLVVGNICRRYHEQKVASRTTQQQTPSSPARPSSEWGK